MQEIHKRAAILMEALPYIKAYHGKTVVIKYGGGAMISPELKESIASDIVLMKLVGISPVIVHGGGPEITAFMAKLNLPVKFINGLRQTDAATMDIVKMVLVGKVNKELVSLINRHGRLAVGLSGDDGNLIMAEPKIEPAGLGYVGEVKKVNTKVLTDLIADDFIPVIASIGAGPDGKSYNINADTVAGEVAAAIKADKVIFLTDVEGLYQDFNDKETLISSLSLKECEAMVQANKIEGGMLPKVLACIQALKSGVKRAHILNGTTEHALLLEIFTNEGIGTMIVG